MSEILIRMVRAEIVEFAYDADMAELHVRCAIDSLTNKLIVTFSGFHHRMALFATSIGVKLRQVIREQLYSDDNLANVVAALRRRYSNRHKDPANAAHFWRLTFLTTDPIHFFDFNPTTDGLEKLNVFSRTKFNTFLEHLCTATTTTINTGTGNSSGIVVYGLVHGNATPHEASELAQSFVHRSGFIPVQPPALATTVPAHSSTASAQTALNRIVRLPCDRSIKIGLPTENVNEKNSVIEMYFQGSGQNFKKTPWGKELAIVRMLDTLLEEPVFNVLRTQEQLGYTVQSSYRMTAGVVGFYFSVISASHPSSHIEERIEYFCNCAGTYFRLLPDAEFVKRRNALHVSLSIPHTDLEESADELWDALTERHFCFDSQTKIANSVVSVTKHDIVEWWDRCVLAPTGRKKLVVCVDARTPNSSEAVLANGGRGSDSDSGSDSGSGSGSGSGSDDDMSGSSGSEDDDEDEDEDESIDFPMSSPHQSVGWWKNSYSVVEVAPVDVASYKATLELLPAPA